MKKKKSDIIQKQDPKEVSTFRINQQPKKIQQNNMTSKYPENYPFRNKQ